MKELEFSYKRTKQGTCTYVSGVRVTGPFESIHELYCVLEETGKTARELRDEAIKNPLPRL